ncbi:hypothetical protein BCR43DRAFT_487270 [Syncephalastrum racemosum]|uniref:Methyltransferase type 11 domain-containing protein n=1 Tax=Syncephalastrum racemosum TaxID=13706 RepID=A0A1X2HQP6_SYNRA|nr:hypothetical protein BCR43DRAFT_487270 [Syncephalastrum racemosum]
MQQVQHKLTSDPYNTDFTPVHPALEPVSPLDATSSSSFTVSSTDEDDSKTISPQTPSSFSPGSPRRVFKNLHGHFLDVQQQRIPFPDNSFDFTMQHMASFSYRRDRWPQILDELVRVTKPGGYIQLFEIDYQSRKLGPEGKAWLFEMIKHVRAKLNIEPTIARHLDKMLAAAGLVEVEARQVSIPIGEWGMDMGALWQQNLEEFLRASGPVISSTMAISMEEYTRRCNRLLKELQYTKAFTNIHAAWARKPLDGHVETCWDECPPFQHDNQQH